MNDEKFFLDKFDLTRQSGEDIFYFSVFPELLPCFPIGIKPSGGYVVYSVHPQYGSCFFSVEQDEACQWVCEHRPSFISKEMVRWVGEQIEEHSR